MYSEDYCCREYPGYDGWGICCGEEQERETWNALTAGQYGDYPGGSIDYDFLGY